MKRKQINRVKTAPKRVTGWWLVVAGVMLAAAGYYGFAFQSEARAAKDSPFVADRAFADLTKMVAFGPRPAGSDAIARTRDYIVAELQKAGLKPQLDEFQGMTPRGPRKMVNIRASRPGSRPGTIALVGHYDTKVFSDIKFLGANDGGSSAAWLLEMARATKDLKLQSTLEFVFYDGEEAVVEWTDADSLYGSRHDVDRRVADGSLRQLKALILVDMIGDKNLNIKKESESTDWLKTIIWNTAASLGYKSEFPTDSLSVEDDHIPYLKAAIPAVDLIDFEYGPGPSPGPYWHTALDTLDKTSGKSLKIVGDVIYFSLQEIDQRVNR
jgi:hypothetical protein